LPVVRPLFAAIDTGNILGLTSTITLSEVLVHPLRTNNIALAVKYREILLFSEHFMTFEILHDISEKAAHLRAKYAIRTPDALQIAGALFYGADCFLTNDTNLKKVSDIPILIIDDFLPS
jgi:predicted nucleic acid-binding protein